jgi:hypothetical protein
MWLLAAGPEIEMTPTASIPPLGSEFNDFLFALAGEDRNGMPLFFARREPPVAPELIHAPPAAIVPPQPSVH